MLDVDDIRTWHAHAPWRSLALVEQDLLLTKAMAAIFDDPWLAGQVAMRGGTALHKIHLAPAARYSEDIDLVLVGDADAKQVARAISRVMAPLGMKERMSPMLSASVAARNLFSRSQIVRSTFAFTPTVGVPRPHNLKIEVNCNERRPLYEVVTLDYRPPELVDGVHATCVRTYDIDEMLGTKMRAFYQRDQGRDLLDLWWALSGHANATDHQADPDRVVAAFKDYMHREGATVGADDFERALDAKLARPHFVSDVTNLLRPGLERAYDHAKAAAVVRGTLVEAMRRAEAAPPAPW